MSYPCIKIYQKLLDYYGYQSWWPAMSDYEMLIGAMLTQNTNWRNVDKAFANLGDKLTPQAIAEMTHDELAALIRPAGYYNQKAERIKLFTEWFRQYDYDVNQIKKLPLSQLRPMLLNLKGVGKETADCMLVYAFDKPSFVIDAYTRRLFNRFGYDVPKNYDDFREFIEREIPKDVQLYNEFHALIVVHAKKHCQTKPVCQGCPLENECLKIIN